MGVGSEDLIFDAINCGEPEHLGVAFLEDCQFGIGAHIWSVMKLYTGSFKVG